MMMMIFDDQRSSLDIYLSDLMFTPLCLPMFPRQLEQ